MSPEYAMDGAFSVKSDTYSFGVILLEIISGLKISLPRLTDFPNLLAYVSMVECSFFFLQFKRNVLNFYLIPDMELMERWQANGFGGLIH